MLYQKPKDVTYTQMAMYIDENVYLDDCDENLIYEYIYHLAYMLSAKARFFYRADDYDEFALYVSTRLFYRYRNNPNKIKSVLNYLKKTLKFSKLAFLEKFRDYLKDADREAEIENNENAYDGYTFSNYLSNSADELIKAEFKCCLNDITKTIKFFLKDIPYTGAEYKNIYMSCLLSFLNSITLSKEEIIRIKQVSIDYDNVLDRSFKALEKDFVILYHLPESMRAYITVLVKQLKHIIAKDLTDIINTEVDIISLSEVMIQKELNGVEFDWE